MTLLEMRHNRKINHLGRKSSHRHALMSNLAASLILQTRINTTRAEGEGPSFLCGTDHLPVRKTTPPIPSYGVPLSPEQVGCR